MISSRFPSLFMGWLLASAVSHPARAEPPDQPRAEAVARVRRMTPEQKADLRRRLERFRQKPQVEQQRILEAARGLERMSPRDRARLLEARERFRSMSPRQRARIRKNFEQFRQLSTEDRSRLKLQVEKLQSLPKAQREALRRKIDRWRHMTPKQQKAVRQRFRNRR